MTDLKSAAKQIIFSAIDAVKPEKLVRRQIALHNNFLKIGSRQFDLSNFRKIYIVGAGKASAFMARELENILGNHIQGGMVVVKYGHGAPCKRVKILEAGHPIVDQNSLSATEEILQIALLAGDDDLVLCLISGGGSAVLEALPAGISLEDLRKVSGFLLASGANIEEINTVRKHLSLVKGGQLAARIAPATCISIILSDIVGDPLEAIASGPTAPDSTTFQDALAVLRKYDAENEIPKSIIAYIQKGADGEASETLKPGDPLFSKVHNIILGNNLEALHAAMKTAKGLGFHTLILSSRLQGEAREAGKVVAAVVQELLASNLPVPRPAGILLGGETTVTLKGDGKGGRNQELALAALLAMKNVKQEYAIASCGTDGTDGPTDAAGAIAGPGIWDKCRSGDINPQEYLDNNDSYHFWQKSNGLIVTGPTGTNVMDIILALVP
ncbi:MAG: glycerate kinase [Calditrichia bacterium]